MKCRLIAALFALLCTIGCPDDAALAAEYRSSRFSDTLGISTHGVSDREIGLIESSGFRVVRIDMRWERVEIQPGRYDWTYYIELAEKLQSHGLRPLFVLSYGNRIYSPLLESVAGARYPVAPPVENAARIAFAKWAAAAAVTFSTYNPIWEIWNEPDTTGFWYPRPDPGRYAQLARSACVAMRKRAPGSTIVAPGAAKAPTLLERSPPFLRFFLNSDAAKCVDAISIHSYLHRREIGHMDTRVGDVRRLIQSAMGSRNAKEVFVTEAGLSSWRGTSELDQAIYAVKTFTLSAASAVPLTVWYDWRDDGVIESDVQHHFGLVRNNGKPKLALQSFQFMAQYIGKSKFVCRAKNNNRLEVLVFSEKGQSGVARAIMWSKSSIFPIQWRPPMGSNKIFDLWGSEIRPMNGQIYITEEPIYAELNSAYRDVCRH